MPTTPPSAASASVAPASRASSAWRPVKATVSRGSARVAAAANAPRDAPVPGSQHGLGRPAPAGRRDEQLPRLPVQAQRPGQQQRSVLAGGAVDPPLQVTDRPLAHLRGLGQLVLGQPGLVAQPPQQPAETQPGLFGHRLIGHGSLSPPPPGASHPLPGADPGFPIQPNPVPVLCAATYGDVPPRPVTVETTTSPSPLGKGRRPPCTS